MNEDINNLEKKKPKITFEEWENQRGLKTVNPKAVHEAISKEWGQSPEGLRNFLSGESAKKDREG